jgi:hypothetical protein
LLRQALLHHCHHLTPFFQHLRREMRDIGQVAAFQGFAANQRQAFQYLGDVTYPLLGKSL